MKGDYLVSYVVLDIIGEPMTFGELVLEGVERPTLQQLQPIRNECSRKANVISSHMIRILGIFRFGDADGLHAD